MKTISLVPRVDRYIWSLENDGLFSVASIRKTLDDNRFQEESLSTRWVKSVPIKVNILAWKVKSNALPTRFNISRRGMDIDSIDCPICKMGVETTSHVFFQCNVVRQVMRKISSWWNVEYMEVNSYEEWRSWLVSTRIRSNIKVIIEGIYYGLCRHCPASPPENFSGGFFPASLHLLRRIFPANLCRTPPIRRLQPPTPSTTPSTAAAAATTPPLLCPSPPWLYPPSPSHLITMPPRRHLFQQLPPLWWAVGGGGLAAAAVDSTTNPHKKKNPDLLPLFHAWGRPPPNHHRGGGRTTIQPPQPHHVVSGCGSATLGMPRCAQPIDVTAVAGPSRLWPPQPHHGGVGLV
ncbi:RNA-directed DNA polymerase, eukaryota, partial [Tanacetum coccineum]